MIIKQSKGRLALNEVNLVCTLLAKGYPMDEVAKTILDEFVILNVY